MSQTSASYNDPTLILGSSAYTTSRLQHATPHHLYVTTRRCFIGPIPEGWLNSHRQDWYKHHLRIHYSSRAATFAAGPNVGKTRRLTGLEGPSASAAYAHAFIQPADVDDDDDDEEEGDEAEAAVDREAVTEQQANVEEQVNQHRDATPDAPATMEDPPALVIPRATSPEVDDHTREPQPRKGSRPHPIPPAPTTTQQDATPKQSAESSLEAGHSKEGKTDNLAAATPIANDQSAKLDRIGSDVTIKAPDQHEEAITTPEGPASTESPATRSVDIARQDRVASGSPAHVALNLTQNRSTNPSDSTASSSALWLSAPTSRSVTRESPRTRSSDSRSASVASFVTADEGASTPQRLAPVSEDDPPAMQLRQDTPVSPAQPSEPDGTTAASSVRQNSTSSLLRHHQQDGLMDASGLPRAETQADVGEEAASVAPTEQMRSNHEHDAVAQPSSSSIQRQSSADPGLVRFNIPGENLDQERQLKVRLARMRKRETFKRLRRGKINDGEIIKVEKMLIRVDFTTHEVPANFTENESEAVECRTIDKWKEFVCVCRESTSDASPVVLQLYKSRVIPAVEKTKVKKRWTHEIQMRPSNTKINLFSSLDKTMVIWHPTRKGTLMYTLNCRSGANSMEWFTFLRNVLGHGRAAVLNVDVPDLDISLQLENPFERLESVQDIHQAAEGDEAAIARAMKEEQAAVSNIITRCMAILRQSPEWQSVIQHWEGTNQMGLAWKRYDRLEWVHGANEKKLYGTIGMEKSHELELRPKEHYPTTVPDQKKADLVEPPPVEGFLVRLTSQRGLEQKLGKFFFKRLYFSTHSQFLVFNRPSRADPPPPPKMPMTSERQIPSAQQIAETTPLIYSVNPYPLDQASNISWLASTITTPEQQIEHDRDAADEHERKIGLLLRCDGLVNLCNIIRVRNVHRGAVPADQNLDSGSDVDFDQEVSDTRRDDGTTPDMDDSRTFELVLTNGLVIRLQAYNATTKHEWMTRLRALVKYWKLRIAADMALYKAVRTRNLALLRLDENAESLVGQFAKKWEVTGSYACPQLFHMCGISCCRTVHMAGMLYRKPRMHGVFKRNLAVLTHGKLLMFADALRSGAGSVVRQIHHTRVTTLDLRDCYIYSGLSTANDLLYQSNGFDKSRPGRHALPRMYVEDGWSSIDEDTMTCFVLWHGKKRSWFRSQGDAQDGKGGGRASLRKVKTLGTEGRSVVFKARSRAERDHWVMSVGLEIERCAGGEDVRVEEVGK